MTAESLIDAITANQYLDFLFKLGGLAIVILYVGLIIYTVFNVLKEAYKALKDIELKYKGSYVDTTAGDEGLD